MLTRRTLRRALLITGMGLGACGALILLLSFIGRINWDTPVRRVTIGNGAFTVTTYLQPRVAPQPGRPRTTTYNPGLWFSMDRSLRWSWQPVLTQATFERFGYLTIPWWLLTALGLISLYFYLPPGYAKSHCQRCNFDLANLPRSPDHHTTCPECGHANRP